MKNRGMKYRLFIYKEIAVFVTNTPMFEVIAQKKKCNPQVISSTETLLLIS